MLNVTRRILWNYDLFFYCLEGLFWLAFYRFAIIILPACYLKKIKGFPQTETLKTETPSTQIYKIKKIVLSLARQVPWKSKCLDQAMAAQRLLLSAGLPSTLYIGFAKSALGKWEAHAWLRCGTEWVVGHRPHMQYTILGTYAKY